MKRQQRNFGAVSACAVVAGALFIPGSGWGETPALDAAVVQGTVQTGIINEISGMAASRQHKNVLWVHNDSGDSARVYALNPDGRLYTLCSLTGATATDWEDMAIATDPVDGED